jgi:hypothetical protein
MAWTQWSCRCPTPPAPRCPPPPRPLPAARPPPPPLSPPCPPPPTPRSPCCHTPVATVDCSVVICSVFFWQVWNRGPDWAQCSGRVGRHAAVRGGVHGLQPLWRHLLAATLRYHPYPVRALSLVGTLLAVGPWSLMPGSTASLPCAWCLCLGRWDRWLQQAINATFMVSVLPLDAAHSAKFDTTAFWQWFATVQGQPCEYCWPRHRAGPVLAWCFSASACESLLSRPMWLSLRSPPCRWHGHVHVRKGPRADCTSAYLW